MSPTPTPTTALPPHIEALLERPSPVSWGRLRSLLTQPEERVHIDAVAARLDAGWPIGLRVAHLSWLSADNPLLPIYRELALFSKILPRRAPTLARVLRGMRGLHLTRAAQHRALLRIAPADLAGLRRLTIGEALPLPHHLAALAAHPGLRGVRTLRLIELPTPGVRGRARAHPALAHEPTPAMWRALAPLLARIETLELVDLQSPCGPAVMPRLRTLRVTGESQLGPALLGELLSGAPRLEELALSGLRLEPPEHKERAAWPCLRRVTLIDCSLGRPDHLAQLLGRGRPDLCIELTRCGLTAEGARAFSAELAPGQRLRSIENPLGATGRRLLLEAGHRAERTLLPPRLQALLMHEGRARVRQGLELLEALPDPWMRTSLIAQLRFEDDRLLPPLQLRYAVHGREIALWLLLRSPQVGQIERLRIQRSWVPRPGGRGSLRHPPLTTLPPEFARLRRLRSLDLTHHELSAVPAVLRALPRLSQLRLDYNRLQQLPAWLAELPLSLLLVRHNRIQRCPPELAPLVRDLTGNPAAGAP